MKSKISILIFVMFLVLSVLNVYAADYKTNLLYFIENGEGKFYGCGLTADARQKIGLKFEFMHNEIGGIAGANDINNDAANCENKGSYYCDQFISPPKWNSAYLYHQTEKVNSLKEILENTAPEGMTEEEWLINVPYYYRIWPVKWYDSNRFLPYYNTTIYPDYPPQVLFKKKHACCPASFCLNGTTCENSSDYIVNPKKPPIFMTYGETGYRCNRNGEWVIASLKPDYTGNDTGYCTSEDECYAGEGRACLISGNWSIELDGKDRMCYAGKWTTRTKYIAAALIDYTKKNNFFEYAIYCDVAERALNSPITNFKLTEGEFFDSYFFTSETFCNGPCANNFCVMRIGSPENAKVIVATSLNREIDDLEYPVFRAFGFNASKSSEKKVDSYENGDEITKIFDSSKSGKLFYSRNKQVIFYTIDDLPGFETDLLGDAAYSIRHPIQTIVGSIQSIFNDNQIYFIEALNKYSDFDRVYYGAKGDKLITGIQERKYNEKIDKLETVVLVEYKGFEANICGAAGNMLYCNASETQPIQTVYASNTDESFFDNIWPDLTAKIRID